MDKKHLVILVTTLLAILVLAWSTSAKYELSAPQGNRVYRLNTVTGEMTAYVVDHERDERYPDDLRLFVIPEEDD